MLRAKKFMLTRNPFESLIITHTQGTVCLLNDGLRLRLLEKVNFLQAQNTRTQRGVKKLPDL